MEFQEISLALGGPGQSQAVSISTTSVQSTAITTGTAVVTPSVECFVRYGSNPTALSDGTDQILLANVMYRLAFPTGSKLAFKTTSGTGTVYITPGA
jgi:hypothetical protein